MTPGWRPLFAYNNPPETTAEEMLSLLEDVHTYIDETLRASVAVAE